MNKYKNLDGLRGLAALVVVFWHYSLAFLPALTGAALATKQFNHAYLLYSTPLHIFIAGPSAVSLFFVLSGFVLSLKFFQVKETSILTSSALRRYFRLMIPSLGSILITYVVLAIGLKVVDETSVTTGSEWLGRLWDFTPNLFVALWQGVYTLFFVHPFDPNQSYNFNLWTMQYELFGSFIVFMVLALFGKMQKRWLVYVAFSIVFLKSFYLGFLLGVVLADVWTSHRAKIENLINPITNTVMLLVGLFLLAFFLPPQMNGIYAHMILPGFDPASMTGFAQAIGGTLVMVAVLSSNLLSKFFESKPLQFLGNISFSLYLLHLVFLGTMACFIFNHLVWRIGYGPALAIAGGATLPTTFFAASLYTRYVDSSSIAFSRLVSNYLLSAGSAKKAAPKVAPLDELPQGGIGQVPALSTAVE